MEVKSANYNQIFLDNRVLRIPFFQRGYVWSECNWEKFFDDILALVNDVDRGSKETYFLGSIILKDTDNSGQTFDVIDGQQRLTTIVMFMKALFLSVGQNRNFLRNFMQMDANDEEKPILMPNYNDQQVYMDIINLQTLQLQPIVENNRLAQAFAYFANRIKEVQRSTSANPISPEKIISVVRNFVKLVVIEVQDGENAQKIFETINCTGIKLTTGELLKNFLFDASKIEEYEHTWKKVFEEKNTKYWEGDMVKGRIQDRHIENFFYHYLLVMTQNPSLKAQLTAEEQKYYRQNSGLFEKFRQLLGKFQISKDEAIHDIISYAQTYLDVFKAGTLDEVAVRYPGIERVAYLMFMQNVWTMTPYILYLIKNVSDKHQLNEIFRYLEVYLIRRIICKSKNNNYSDLFSENLIGGNIRDFASFKAYVSDASNRGALLIPSDDEVIKAVKNNDLKRDAQIVLYMLESRINKNFDTSKHNNCFNAFSKEQIMPEKTSASWPLTSGYTEEQHLSSSRTLGNFTLTREPLKGKMKKAPWSEKVKALKPFTDELELSKFTQRDLVDWNEKAIEKQNDWLASKIIEAWPLD